jgi:tetratricopeptide (TPR) repeat protein
MDMRVWHGVLAAIITFSFVGEIWSQESRPTDYADPTEVGAIPKISPEESERRLQDAMLLFDRGKTDAATYMLQQLEKADPTNYKVLFKLGEIAIAEKNWAYSLDVLRKASYIRPEDIEVRLILMDIYKAYQMPIQEIIVGKEILVLDPEYVVTAKRLAGLYKEQAMQEDEISIRQKLKRLTPDDYQNLKRLAVVFDENGQLWESAKVYEQIREYYPEKLEDMQHLAAIYDRLGENFREAQVLDHIAERGGGRSWMQSRAETSLRKQTSIYDPFQARLIFSKVQEETMDVYTIRPEAKYTRIRVNRSFDLGVEASFTALSYNGVGVLDGTANIYSSSVIFKAIQNWPDLDFTLGAHVGLIDDRVSGRLFLSDPDGPIGADNFPFLADSTFNSYGGTIPIGGLKFKARPGLYTDYSVDYKHDLVKEFDARLRLFTFDKLTLGVKYETSDHTELELQIDNAYISDGNYRFHGVASGYYALWASNPIYDSRSRRQGFFREPPPYFIKVGYELEYFKDRELARDAVYETFVSPEIRHKGVILGQAQLYTLGPDEQILFNLRLFYGVGTTLDYRRGFAARLFYFKPDSTNEVGLTYTFEDEDSTNFEIENLGVAGRTTGHQVELNMKWRF